MFVCPSSTKYGYFTYCLFDSGTPDEFCALNCGSKMAVLVWLYVLGSSLYETSLSPTLKYTILNLPSDSLCLPVSVTLVFTKPDVFLSMYAI